MRPSSTTGNRNPPLELISGAMKLIHVSRLQRARKVYSNSWLWQCKIAVASPQIRPLPDRRRRRRGPPGRPGTCGPTAISVMEKTSPIPHPLRRDLILHQIIDRGVSLLSTELWDADLELLPEHTLLGEVERHVRSPGFFVIGSCVAESQPTHAVVDGRLVLEADGDLPASRMTSSPSCPSALRTDSLSRQRVLFIQQSVTTSRGLEFRFALSERCRSLTSRRTSRRLVWRRSRRLARQPVRRLHGRDGRAG